MPHGLDAFNMIIRHPLGYIRGNLLDIFAFKRVEPADFQGFRIGILWLDGFYPGCEFRQIRPFEIWIQRYNGYFNIAPTV